jgi:hypothetical protein
MAFGKNQTIIQKIRWIRRIIMHALLMEKEHRHDFGNRRTCGGMPV